MLSLGSLILDLKKKNDTMEIFVCELVPTLGLDDLDDRISQYNTKLKEWSSNNGIKIISTYLNFRFGTGDVDEMCFKMENDDEGIFLNRHGVVRLLKIISKQCPYFKLTESLHDTNRRQANPLNSAKRNNDRQPFHKEPRANENTLHHHGIKRQTSQRNSWDNNHNRNSNSRWNRIPSEMTRQRHGYQRSGCYNCGEFNHRQSQCRFDHKVKCASCHSYGHKSKLCNFYDK